MRTGFILPTFNEKNNAPALVHALLQSGVDPLDIYILDDASPDGTVKALRKKFGEHSNVHIIQRTPPHGYKVSIEEGISRALKDGADIVGWMDADFSHPPELLSRMVLELNEADVVVASRYIQGGRDLREEKLHVLLSRIICTFGTYWLNRKFLDWTSGYILAKRDVFTDLELRGSYGEFFPVMVNDILKKGWRVKEMPYINVSRRYGESKTASDIRGFFKHGPAYVYSMALAGLHR